MKTVLCLLLMSSAAFSQATVERLVLTSYAFQTENGFRYAIPAVCLLSKEIEITDLTSIEWQDSLTVVKITMPANLEGTVQQDTNTVILGAGAFRNDKAVFRKYLRKTGRQDPGPGGVSAQNLIAHLRQMSRERKGGRR